MGIARLFPIPGISCLFGCLQRRKLAESTLVIHQRGTSTLLHQPVKELNRGAAKIIWQHCPTSEEREAQTRSAHYVYCTAIRSCLWQRERELRREEQTMHMLGTLLPNPAMNRHLAIQLEPVQGSINRQYTVKFPRAEHDLRKELTDQISLADSFHYGEHLLSGFASLHGVNYAHGDFKPDNCLVYKEGMGKEVRKILKVSDFGKARRLGFTHQTFASAGNMLYASPEKKVGQASDIYSLSLVLIRLLESTLPSHENSLITTYPGGIDDRPAARLRGLERYIVSHKAFPALNKGSWLGYIRQWWGGYPIEPQVTAIHQYIDTLFQVLKNCLGCEGASALSNLLKQMTDGNPLNRPSAQEALQRYQLIFSSWRNRFVQ